MLRCAIAGKRAELVCSQEGEFWCLHRDPWSQDSKIRDVFPALDRSGALVVTFEGVRYSVEEVFAQTFREKSPTTHDGAPSYRNAKKSNRVGPSMPLTFWMRSGDSFDGRGSFITEDTVWKRLPGPRPRGLRAASDSSTRDTVLLVVSLLGSMRPDTPRSPNPLSFIASSTETSWPNLTGGASQSTIACASFAPYCTMCNASADVELLGVQIELSETFIILVISF